MKVFWDPIQLSHAPQFFLQRGVVKANYEVPARAEALLAACRRLGLDIELPGAADLTAIAAIHSADYLDFLQNGWAAWQAMEDHGPELVPNVHPTPEMLAHGAKPSSTIMGQAGWFVADASSPIAASTWTASLAAAAGAVAAADAVAAGKHAYALARPPGHHAYVARAGGHCFLNNAAIAAQRLRHLGAARVAVLDIDSHHGNGTQGIFWDRTDVFFASIHGDPNGYYPWYVGHADEKGGGNAVGYNLNLPLAKGSADAVWLAAIDHALTNIQRIGADALVVSLGFDASEDEPLHFLSVTADGFARAGAAIAKIGLKTALVQEGGYNTAVMGGLLEQFIAAF